MPTTLPRTYQTWDLPTFDALTQLSKMNNKSATQVVSELVHYALDLIEDSIDAEIGEERLKTFDRSKALTTEQMIAALNRKKKTWGKKHTA
jgi:hypothetical protein